MVVIQSDPGEEEVSEECEDPNWDEVESGFHSKGSSNKIHASTDREKPSDFPFVDHCDHGDDEGEDDP